MKDILAKAHREVLARFARADVLVALDFDGTLAPITLRPASSKMRAKTARLLARLALRYPVAVISGRAQADVVARTHGVPVFAVSGNHGLEPSRDLERYRRLVHRWSKALQARLAGVAGVELEDKVFSLSVHYRRATQKRRARQEIAAAVGSLVGGARAFAGKQVVNVVPEGAPHKGEALLRMRGESGADTAIYVGDDVTDEDVFKLGDPQHLLGIRVGRSRHSAARWYIRSQSEIDELLARLLELRAGV